MGSGIRGRIFTWLLIAIVPVLSVALTSTVVVEDRIAEQVVDELTKLQRLEVNRITTELDQALIDADRLARATFVELFTEQVQLARSGQLDPDVTIGEVAGFDAIDPKGAQPLEQVAKAIRDASLGAGTSVLEAKVVGLDGNSLGASAGYSWNPSRPGLVAHVLEGNGARYGSAFLAGTADARVGLVTPITNTADQVVGALLAEVAITPILSPLAIHHEFGSTTEAILVQPGPAGQVQYISDLRFSEGPSSFTLADAAAPIGQALGATEPTVIDGLAYHGEPSVYVVETIEVTGWGLVIRVDRAEAFGISYAIRALVLAGSGLAVIALVLGWALLLRPLVRRIRSAAIASDRVADGDYTTRIDDRLQDEIGEVSRGIDRLAADLEYDARMRADAERRLRYQATHDELTNIFNRQHMTSVIRESLAVTDDVPVSLLFLDLDDFKLVNDLWGHAVGDEVLTAVASRLQRLVTDDVLVSRWGGDEFTVVLTNADQAAADELAERVRLLFADPINTSVGPHPMSCSVGVAAAYTSDEFDQLLHDADARMFEAKQANRTSRMVKPDTARLVDTALTDGRIEAHYQPIVHLVSPTQTQIYGIEALVRIRATDGSLCMPSEFLNEVQSHRYAREIDAAIATMALRDLNDWKLAGLVPPGFRVALNLSPASMRDAGLAQSLCDLAVTFAIEPGTVVLELSEEAEDLDLAVTNRLRAAGYLFAVDDLGLKRSNFDRLLSGTVDVAKLDRRWLDDPVVFSSLMRTCTDKQLTVIAEGVETYEQLAFLYEQGVRLCQGFLFARPQPASEICRLAVCRKSSAVLLIMSPGCPALQVRKPNACVHVERS